MRYIFAFIVILSFAFTIVFISKMFEQHREIADCIAADSERIDIEIYCRGQNSATNGR